jgi:autotransporter-associated beta strand protein
VTVKRDASQGGYSAQDAWRNDISGSGGLIKQGTGELGLTGNNTFTGDVVLEEGALVAAAEHALGNGNVYVHGGTLVDYALGTLTIKGNFTEVGGGVLEMVIGSGDDGLARGLMSIGGQASLDGTLRLTFLSGFTPSLGLLDLLSAAGVTGHFSSLVWSGLADGYGAELIYSANGVQVNITAVPEPESLLLMLTALGVCAVVGRRRMA